MEEKVVNSIEQIDRTISREGFNSEKYDLRKSLFGRDDVMPMWVADMDLPTPPFIVDALKQRLEHPILGYTLSDDATFQAVIDWQAQHNYDVEKSQIIFTHNVANGFFMAIQAFTEPGEAVLVQPPIYPPFLSAPEANQRKLVEAPVELIKGSYQINFDAFEKLIIEHDVKLFLFCNPQNPSGRVWQREELFKLADICLKHQVTIVSDEIHSDLVYEPYQHIPIASLSSDIANNTITLSSPGKTFNLGGLQIGYAIIANPELKAAYLKICNANRIDGLNLFAQEALKAAYSQQGKQWRDDLKYLLNQHFDHVDIFFKQYLPKVEVMRPQASYLLWLDFKCLFKDQQTLKHWLIHDAKLGLNDGVSFGGQSLVGNGFMRLNVAVSSEVLTECFSRIKSAVRKLDN